MKELEDCVLLLWTHGKIVIRILKNMETTGPTSTGTLDICAFHLTQSAKTCNLIRNGPGWPEGSKVIDKQLYLYQLDP